MCSSKLNFYIIAHILPRSPVTSCGRGLTGLGGAEGEAFSLEAKETSLSFSSSSSSEGELRSLVGADNKS